MVLSLELLLGHTQIDHVMPYLEVQPNRLREKFLEVI